MCSSLNTDKPVNVIFITTPCSELRMVGVERDYEVNSLYKTILYAVKIVAGAFYDAYCKCELYMAIMLCKSSVPLAVLCSDLRRSPFNIASDYGLISVCNLGYYA